MIPATVLLGSMAAGGLGLYLRGSTGPSELEKTVDDSVSAVTEQVSAVTQQVSDATQQVTESVSDFVQKDNNPEPVAVPKPVPAEPVEPVPVEPVEQPVEQPVESVEQPVEQEPVEPEQPVEAEDNPTGAQRGGYGRPTWAPLNSGSSLMQALGVQPGSTSGNLLATATGSKTPQQIQQELVAVEQEIRRLKTQEFLTTKTLTDESTSFGTTRANYTKQVNTRERSKNLLKIYERELASILDPKPATSDLKPEVFAKFPRNKADGTPMFTKKDKGGKDVDDFEGWKKDAYTKASALPDGDQLKPLAGDDANKWWNKLSSGPGSAKKTSATELTKLLDDKERETTNLENAEQEIYKLKFTFETKQKIVEELRSQVREFIDKSREAEKRKEELLEELSEYKVPTSFWDKNKRPEAPKSAVPTGEELNRLLVEYKDIQELIKQKQEEIDEEVGIQLEDGNLKDSTNYDRLNTEKDELENQRQGIIAKIEGRSTDQTKQIRALNELDIFIKQLKEQKVKAVTLFDNPDFRKVFDMLTLMSLDSDPKSFVVNMDKYSNFFVTTKGFSAYNGEVLDKAFYFLNNYDKLIKDARTLTIIGAFGMEFKTKNIENTSENIKNTKTFLENSGITSTEEFKKLDATQRRILEGRSTAWHTFFTDSDRLKAIPRAFSSVLFKTELDKLVKLESVIKRRILDKIDKTKFETVTTAPSVALTGLSWYTKYIPDVSAWFKSKPADRKQFLLAFCKKFKEENIQKIERFDKEFEKYEKLITEKATKGINGSLLTMSDAISELETIIPKTEKERDRRLDPKLKRRIQADIDDYTQRKLRLETNLNSYKNERKSSMQLKEINKDVIAKLDLLKDDENCLKNAERVLKDIRLLNRCDEIFQRVLAEQKDILKDLPKLEQYLRSALRQQGDFSPAEIEDCIKRKLNELEDPFNSCVNFVYPELTGDERNGKTEITDKRIQEIVDASNGKITTEQVKECILKTKARTPKLPGLTPIVITPGPVTDTSITLSWTGADGAEFTLNGTKVTSPHTINGLMPDTEYTYKIIGTLGTETVESDIKVKTARTGTSLTPIVITAETTDTTVTLSWTGADGAVFSLSPRDPSITSPYTITGLTPDTEYTYKITGSKGTDNVVAEIRVRTKPSPLAIPDAGTETDKKEICLMNTDKEFLWNKIKYTRKTNEKKTGDDCIVKFTAESPDGTEYDVTINDISLLIESFIEKPKIKGPDTFDISDLQEPDLFIQQYVATNNIKLLGAPKYETADKKYNLKSFFKENSQKVFEKWEVVDTNGDGNCLTHAFLQSLSPTYGRIENTADKNNVAIAFRLEFAKTDLARNKALYNSAGGTDWLTDNEISDYSRLFNVIVITFDQANQRRGVPGIQAIKPMKQTDIKDDTKVIFIYASGNHYSSIRDENGNFYKDYFFAKDVGGLILPLTDIPGPDPASRSGPADLQKQIQTAVDTIKTQTNKGDYKTMSNGFIEKATKALSDPKTTGLDKIFLQEKIAELKNFFSTKFGEEYDPVVPPKPTVPPLPPKDEGPLKLAFPTGRPKPATMFSLDNDKWLRTLQEQVNIFNRAYNTNLVYTNDDLKTINEIIKILNTQGIPSTTQLDDTDFSPSLRNRLKEKLDTRIAGINLAFTILYDDLVNKRRGGNHETRRHRVRGMPKRAKTRRMY